ncbi:hypothetical protein [Streptomyces sp. NPDC056672]|uniref:hypothetical protein n=1 Tax=Streptomyces sp. NPDC056672 TaxID=3345906 RepID=UPI0036D1F51B
MPEERPNDEPLTPMEQAWLESPDEGRGYQPTGESPQSPPSPPAGRASASQGPEPTPEPADGDSS